MGMKWMNLMIFPSIRFLYDTWILHPDQQDVSTHHLFNKEFLLHLTYPNQTHHRNRQQK
jgi:hypothetical protein